MTSTSTWTTSSRALTRDLVGKFVNIASRSAGFIAKRFGGKLRTSRCRRPRAQAKMRGAGRPAPDDEQAPAILFEVRSFADAIAADYEAREFGKAIRQVMFLADRVNQYVDEQKPWEIAKEPARTRRCSGSARSTWSSSASSRSI